MKPKYEPMTYHVMSKLGMSNRQIARILGVSEASVRRGLLASVELAPTLEERVDRLERELKTLRESLICD